MIFLISLLLSPLDDLGADDWRAREQATAALVSRDWFALPTVLVGRHSSDPEVRARCRRVLCLQASARIAAADALFRPTDYPFLDSFWYDTERRAYLQPWPDVQPYVTSACANVEPAFAINYGGYRQASRDWMRDGLARGVPVWWYRLVFVELRRRDAVYLGTVRP